jgi:hypothetical protein
MSHHACHYSYKNYQPVYTVQYLYISVDPYEASVPKRIKWLALISMSSAMHSVPIVCLPDFEHYDVKYTDLEFFLSISMRIEDSLTQRVYHKKSLFCFGG